MRTVWPSAFVVSMSIGCAPPEASVPEEREERPCQSDDDCEIAGRDTSVHSAMCKTPGAAGNPNGRSNDGGLTSARCGSAVMKQAAVPEPVFACFRGACVPIGSR